MRDLKGYGHTPPHANWPGGARVAVSFVINFEEGAEMSLSSGDAFNEKTYEVTDEISGIPDRCMESHFEYGTKAAWWRIADTLERLAVSTTVSTCGQAAELSPWLIEDAVRRGHEISCHGWRWERHAHLKEDEEREKIARTHKVLSAIAGTPVVGWHTRSTPSPNTRRLLVEHGGFLYDSDDYSDDLPFQVQVSGKKHLVITGVAIVQGGREQAFSVPAWVSFRELTDAEIAGYVATGEPMDKAGAYGIQGRAAIFVEEIRGSHSGIMGLPLFETARLPHKVGVKTL